MMVTMAMAQLIRYTENNGLLAYLVVDMENITRLILTL